MPLKILPCSVYVSFNKCSEKFFYHVLQNIICVCCRIVVGNMNQAIHLELYVEIRKMKCNSSYQGKIEQSAYEIYILD